MLPEPRTVRGEACQQVTSSMRGDEILPLFVFGTLRRGESNHHFLHGRYDRCLAAVLRGFGRGVAGHGFPAISLCVEGLVEGELFWLTPHLAAEVMADCDRLEDLPVGELAGPYYRRACVPVEAGGDRVDAWAYVSPETPVEPSLHVRLPSGSDGKV